MGVEGAWPSDATAASLTTRGTVATAKSYRGLDLGHGRGDVHPHAWTCMYPGDQRGVQGKVDPIHRQ